MVWLTLLQFVLCMLYVHADFGQDFVQELLVHIWHRYFESIFSLFSRRTSILVGKSKSVQVRGENNEIKMVYFSLGVFPAPDCFRKWVYNNIRLSWVFT